MESKRLVGYARVSTIDQTVNQQLDALRKVGCERVFEDVISGSSTTRDGLDQCLAELVAGDTLVVVALDRLGRSMLHLVTTVHELGARGVDFRSLRENIDTTTPTGVFMLHVFGALAELERELVRDRTKAALSAKKQRGEPLGRRRLLTPAQVREATEMFEAGKGASHVARMFKVDRATLYRALKRPSI